VFGAAIKHENYNQITVSEDFIVKPVDGFGDRNLLRSAIAQIKPDAVLLFTDPRFFMWVWEMEDEIRQICPIVYNHLWDNPPWPEFQRHIYESTDLINCINWPTYEMVSERFPEKTHYIPHAVPADVYFPMERHVALNAKISLLGKQKEDHFVALFVSRNAKRKAPADILVSWRDFLDELEVKHGHRKATILMHCDPVDPEGTNLHEVVKLLELKDNVIFSKDRVGFEEMVALYNVCDVFVNRSTNEGFGLGVLEAKMCGKPVISIKTGGLTRQVVDHVTGEEYGIALEPDVRSLTGNLSVPYIYEDHVSHKTLSDAFMKMHEFGPSEREKIGSKALEHARREYSLDDTVSKWDNTLTECFENWKSRHNRWELTEI